MTSFRRRRPQRSPCLANQALHHEPLEPRMVLSASPLITEFLAVNDSSLSDDDGDSSDWVEVHNPASTPLDLDGWHLTDDEGDLTKWRNRRRRPTSWNR